MKKPITAETRAHEAAFRSFLKGEFESRATTFIAGTASPTYTAGNEGGFLVPESFYSAAVEGLALTDPLFDGSVVSLHQEPDFSLREMTIPGWDLSSIKSAIVGESSLQSAGTIPVLSAKLTKGFTYRLSLDASLEIDEDAKAYGAFVTAMGRAHGAGQARGVSADLVVGDGTSAPRGILIDATDSGVTAANVGKLVLGDFVNVFYSVNKVYRDAPKAAWLVTDAVAKMISNCVDDQHRPLFPIEDGVTFILGRPVYVSPSLPLYNPSLGQQASGSFCLFGDLSQFHVHASTMLLRRFTEAQNLIDFGLARYQSLLRVDSRLHDSTTGAVISARLHA